MVFGEEVWRPYKVLGLIYSLAEDIKRCFTKGSILSHSVSHERWQAPLSGLVKLNVDGSVMGSSSRGGVGGLVCDGSSMWLGGFSAATSCCNILRVELLAILFGLRLLKD